MILQSTDELERFVGNKYSLVIVSAKRARQIKDGHIPLARDSSPNPLSLAMAEIGAQQIQAIAPQEEEIAPAPRDVISSLVAGTEFDLEDEMGLEETDAVDDLAALLVGEDEDDEEEHEAEEDPLAAVAAPVAGIDGAEQESEDSDAETAGEGDDEDEESVDEEGDEDEGTPAVEEHDAGDGEEL